MLGASIVATLMGSVAPIFMMQGMDIAPERIARGAIHVLVLGARSAVDLQYEGLVYDERSMGVSLRGVTVAPPTEMGLTDCILTAEALSLTPAIAEDSVGLHVETDGLSAAPACAQDIGMIAAAMFGPQALGADRASIDLDYAMGRSALSISAYLQTAQTGTVDLAVAMSGLHTDLDEEGGETLGGTLDAFEVTVDNLDRLRDMLPMLGVADDPATEATSMLREGLGDIADSEAGQAFIDSAKVEIARFVEDGGALTIRMTADDPVPLSALMATAGPEETIPLLEPVLAARPEAGEALYVWDTIDAMEGDFETLSGERKREIAQAFAAGRGVPRSDEMALALYTDLAEEGDAEAALAAALLIAEADTGRAYALALDAGASDARGARLALDRIESTMALDAVLRAQGSSAEGGDAGPVGDPATLRSLARDAFDGQGARRSYRDALLYASLAAAAGDRASKQLYDRLVDRFDGEEGWSDTVREVSGRALRMWTAGGVGAAFAE